MPLVKNNPLLKAVYTYMLDPKVMDTLPSQMLFPGQTLHRVFSPYQWYSRLRKPQPGGSISPADVDSMLTPNDGLSERGNRFTGPPHGVMKEQNYMLPYTGGLYTALQQEALVNEKAHYSGRRHLHAVDGQAILKIVLTQPFLVADLSPHNHGAPSFLSHMKLKGFDKIPPLLDLNDCSVARGIGAAILHRSPFSGIIFQTARSSDRSDEEKGDNVVLLGTTARPIPGIAVQSVTFYNQATQEGETFPVSPA